MSTQPSKKKAVIYTCFHRERNREVMQSNFLYMSYISAYSKSKQCQLVADIILIHDKIKDAQRQGFRKLSNVFNTNR